jgi:hypothetical protein
MAVTAKMFDNAPHHAYHKAITDLGGADGVTKIYCCLLTSGYGITQASDSYADIVTDAHEHGATGTYVAGGIELTTKTLTNSSHVTTFNADDALWAASTISAAGAVVYDNTPAANGDKKLLVLIDFGGTFSSTAGDFQITWSASGIFTDTVA